MPRVSRTSVPCSNELRENEAAAATFSAVVARDRKRVSLLVERLGGETACAAVGSVSELEELQVLSKLRAVIFVLEDFDPEAPARLARAGRRLVPDGAVVLLTSWSLSAVETFFLMNEGVDVCEMRCPSECPDRLLALLEGTSPGMAYLRAFCKRQRLSPMETRAFLAACAGLSKVEAHEQLGCSIRTLESHWSRIFGKIGIRCTDGVISAALRDLLLRGGRQSEKPEPKRAERVVPLREPSWPDRAELAVRGAAGVRPHDRGRTPGLRSLAR